MTDQNSTATHGAHRGAESDTAPRRAVQDGGAHAAKSARRTSRYILPLTCVVLSLGCLLYGKNLIGPGQDRAFGPLTAHETVLMAAIAFAAMALVTFLLSFLPVSPDPTPLGAPTPAAHNEDLPLPLADPSPNSAAHLGDDTADEHLGKHEVAGAIMTAALRSVAERDAECTRADQAEQRVRDLEAELRTLRDGGTQATQVVRQRILDEAAEHHERRFNEMREAHERLAETWESRTAAAEERADRAEQRARVAESTLRSVQDSAEETHAAGKAEARSEERTRLLIALEAVSRSTLHGLTGEAAAAVRLHADRAMEAIHRLDTQQSNAAPAPPGSPPVPVRPRIATNDPAPHTGNPEPKRVERHRKRGFLRRP